jgi:hypothetical protein
VILLLSQASSSSAFILGRGSLMTRYRVSPLCLAPEEQEDKGSENEKPENEPSFQEKVDSFLDTPFFDPSSKNNGPLQWFANLVDSDYETAEALYAGVFFVILVVLTQEILRMQLSGDAYVPFRHGGASGLW